MKMIAVGLLAAGIVSGVVIYGMAQPGDRPAGPPRGEGAQRAARPPRDGEEPGKREPGAREPGPREKGDREPGNREFHVLPPEARNDLKLSDDQLKQIVDLDKDIQARLAKILTPEQLERWNKPAPVGPRDQRADRRGPPRGEDGAPPPRDENGPPRGDRREEAGPPRGDRPAGPPRGEDGPRPPRDEKAAPPRDRVPQERGAADRGPEDRRGPPRDDDRPTPRGEERRGPPRDDDRPAPRGDRRPEPRDVPTAADYIGEPPVGPPPPPSHGPQEFDRAVDDLRLDEATFAKAHELVHAHHEKVRKFMDEQRADLVKQMTELLGEAKGAEFEKSLPPPPPPPPPAR